MAAEPEEAIWKFATGFYARPGVASACLTLQDEANLDVVHLILLLYADHVLGRPLTAEDLPALQSRMAGWREAAVLPLRAVRQRLRSDETGFPREKEDLRFEVKRVELLAERMQLAMGEDWLRDRQTKAGLPLEEALHALLRLYGGESATDNDRCTCALSVIIGAAGGT